MKLPDSSKSESALRRVFDQSVQARFVYWERVVLIKRDQGKVKQLGYRCLLVTEHNIYVLPKVISEATGQVAQLDSIDLLSVSSVEQLETVASFFSDEYSSDARHLSISSEHRQLDVFTFYSDSRLLHMLRQTWIHAHAKMAMPALYGVPGLADLAHGGYVQLFQNLGAELGTIPDTDYSWKGQAVDELTVLCSHSKELRVTSLDTPVMVMFVVREMEALSDLAVYFEGTPLDTLMASRDNVSDDIAKLDYISSLYGLLVALLAGSESTEKRLAILSPSSPHTLATMVTALLLTRKPDKLARSSTAMSMLADLSRARGGTSNSRLLPVDENTELKGSGPPSQRSLGGLSGNDNSVAGDPSDVAGGDLEDRLRARLVDVLHGQAALLYHLFGLFEYARHREYRNLNVETLFRLLRNSSEMFVRRASAFWTLMCGILLDAERTPANALAFYHLAHVLRRCTVRLTDIRDCLRREHRPDISIRLKDGEVVQDLQGQLRSFFYKQGCEELLSLLNPLVQ